MKMWSVQDKACLKTWDTYYFTDLATGYEGNHFAFLAGGTNTVHFVNVQTREIEHKIEEEDKVRSITMSRNGKYLLSNFSESNPTINLWNVSNRKHIQKYTGHVQSKYILNAEFAGKNDEYVVCGSEDDLIYLWNRSTGE